MSVTQSSFDEAVNMTATIEEATEAGYLGVNFDEDDHTVQGVTGVKQSAKSQAKPPTPIPTAKVEKAEPESHKSRRGE
jgi:Iap family predicted aminopeptidase